MRARPPGGTLGTIHTRGGASQSCIEAYSVHQTSSFSKIKYHYLIILELELYIQGFESEIILEFLECTVYLWLFGVCVCVGELVYEFQVFVIYLGG